VSLTATSTIYYKLAVLFVTLENHKYQKDHDRSFMLKLVSFRLVNTHLTVLYAVIMILTAEDLLSECKSIKTKYDYIYNVILATTLAKVVSTLITRYFVYRWLMFWKNKRSYFGAVAKAGKLQEAKHQQFDAKSIERDEQVALQKKSDLYIFKDVLEGDYDYLNQTIDGALETEGQEVNNKSQEIKTKLIGKG